MFDGKQESVAFVWKVVGMATEALLAAQNKCPLRTLYVGWYIKMGVKWSNLINSVSQKDINMDPASTLSI